MGGKAEPCPTPMLTQKEGEEKLFQRYFVFLPIRQSLKNVKILESKPALSKIKGRS